MEQKKPDIVLVVDDGLRPYQHEMIRIIENHPNLKINMSHTYGKMAKAPSYYLDDGSLSPDALAMFERLTGKAYVPPTFYIDELSDVQLEVYNNLELDFPAMTDEAWIFPGQMKVTGKVTAYFEDKRLWRQLQRGCNPRKSKGWRKHQRKVKANARSAH